MMPSILCLGVKEVIFKAELQNNAVSEAKICLWDAKGSERLWVVIKQK